MLIEWFLLNVAHCFSDFRSQMRYSNPFFFLNKNLPNYPFTLPILYPTTGNEAGKGRNLENAGLYLPRYLLEIKE